MNTVLYTPDLEPITVVDLPVWIQESIEKKGSGYILVTTKANQEDPPMIMVRCKRLQDENQVIHKFFVTTGEELALTIMPKWLPGQVQIYNGLMQVIEKQRATIKRLTKPNSAE